MSVRNAFMFIGILAVLFSCWEVFSDFNQDFIFVLPAPSQVFIRLWDKVDRFGFHTLITLKEMLAGFLIAFLVAFPSALLMDRFALARSILQPFFILVQCIPMFTLAPIMVVWFGWSFTAVVIPTALMIFFPLTITIYQGLRSVPQELLDYFKTNQATSWQTFIKLKLPWAMPYLFSGFRLAAAIAGIAAVAGEWAGSQSGLGVLMVESRRDTDLETNFAALFCLTFISYALYFLTVTCERLALRRRPIKALIKQCWQFKLAWLFLVATTGSLILISSCQREAPKNSVRLILDWLPNPNHVPLYVGLQKGFFQERGINLNIQKLQEPGHSTTYLLIDQCELALTYMPYVIRSHQKSDALEPVGILIQEPLNALIFREGEIDQLKDLEGKKFGFCTGGKNALFLDALLSKHQLRSHSQLNVGFDLVTSLGAKKVDVLYGAYWNIETAHLRSLGIPTRYFTFAQLGVPTYYELIFLAKKNTPYAQPIFVDQFKKALQKSIDYSKLHPDEAFAIYCSYQSDKSEKTREWEKEAWLLTIPTLAEQQTLSPQVWTTFEEWLRAHHLL